MLSGCSGDPFENYLGLWESQDGRNVVIEVSRDGESIIANVITYNKKETIVLTKSEGQLSLHGATLGLSEDKNTLRKYKKAYRRIDDNRFNHIKTCNKLNEEYMLSIRGKKADRAREKIILDCYLDENS